MFKYKIILFSFVWLSQSLKLFGGGCIVDDMKLIISGSFSEGASLTNESYELKLDEIELNNQQVKWQISYPSRPHPGDLVPITYKNVSQGLFYVLGATYREFDIPPILKRRNRVISESPLYDSTLAQILKKNNSLVVWTTAIEKIYYQNLVDNLKLGFHFNHYMFFIENFDRPYKIGETIKIISAYSYFSGKIIPKLTTGDAPRFESGFSATLKYPKLYITGGYSSKNNIIYVLLLRTLHWESHSVAGFYGYQSGCLAVKDNLLIHAFGRSGSSVYLETTQLVNLTNWMKINRYNHIEATKEYTNSSRSEHWPLYAIIIIVGISIIITSFLIYISWRYYAKYRKKLYELPPPNFHLDSIWTPFIIKFEMDMSLISSPNSYYGNTSPLPPLAKTLDLHTVV